VSDGPGRRVTVLHVAGLPAGHQEVAATAGGTPVDLLLVTGDVAQRGRSKEYTEALVRLDALAAAVGTPRERVVLVPGPGDVNLDLCQAYFLQQAAEDEPPQPPYYPKWRPWESFLRQWSDRPGAQGFDPGQPWALVELPELHTVVATLNSTTAWSPRSEEQHAEVGRHQLDWFAERLARYQTLGWLRIGAVHHDPTGAGFADGAALLDQLGPHLNLVLHSGPRGGPAAGGRGGEPVLLGAGPNGAQLLDLTADGLRRSPAGPRNGGPGRERHGVRWSGARSTFPPDVRDREHRAVDPQPDVAVRPDDFARRVTEICHLKHPGATVSVVEPAGDVPMYLRVSLLESGFVRQRPVGLAEAGVDADVLDHFVRRVHRSFAAADPYLRSELVYGGPPAGPDLVARARAASVDLRSFVEFQGLMDLRGYVDRQTDRLNRSTLYPPSTYVPQRFRMLPKRSGQREVAEPAEDLLGRLFEWLAADDQCFVLVLGDFGLGKTFVLQELARQMPQRLPNLVPMLVELRDLEKARSVDELIAQHFVAADEREYNLDAFRYMLREGRVVLIFDGFDELALRVRYDRAADRLTTLLQALEGRAKIVVSSRSQHFESSQQVRTALGDKVARLPGARLVELVGFDDAQIRAYLQKLYAGDALRAQDRMHLLAEVNDLLGLSRNPRMLTFIAGIPDDRLQRARARDGSISSADLYAELLDQWFHHEDWRASPRGAASPLSLDDRRRAATALALRLWQSTDGRVDIGEIGSEAGAVLEPLAQRDLDEGEAAQLVGSGTLLVRDDVGRFSFVHQSVMEWLVAAHAAEELRAGTAPHTLELRPMSALMADFLGGLVGRGEAVDWARATLDRHTSAAQATGDTAKTNARLVLQRMGEQQAGQAHLRGHSLRGDVLVDVDLKEADLAGADLSQARIVGTDLSRASLRDAVLDRTLLERVRLAGADLRGARVTRSRLVDTDLTGARLEGSAWTRTALIGPRADPGVLDSPEFAAAAVVGRDAATVVRPPAMAPVTALAFSSDGSLLAFATGHAVVIADAETGRMLRTLHGHDEVVTSVVFSADARLVVAGGAAGRLCLWRVEDARPRDGVTSLAAGADQGTVLVGSQDGTVTAWPLLDLTRPLLTLPTGDGPVAAMAVAPAPAASSGEPASGIATAHADGTVRLWTLSGTEPVRTLRGSPRALSSLAFHPDGGLVAAGGADGRVRLWRLADGSVRDTITAHARPVQGLAFRPDGLELATGGADGAVRLWNVADASLVATLTGHANQVRAVAFAPDGQLLASGGNDGVAVLWSAHAHSSRARLTGRQDQIMEMAATTDGSVIGTGGEDGCLRLWRPRESRCTVIEAADEAVFGVGFTADGATVAIGLAGGGIQVRRLSDGALRPSPTGVHHRSPVRHIAFSPNGQLLATAASEGRVRLWRTDDAVLLNALSSPTRTVAGLSFSPDGELLATAGGDETVQLWDVDEGVVRTRVLTGRTRVVSAISFDPSGRYLASGAGDGAVQLWHAADRQLHRALDGHTGLVQAVAFSADGELLASAGQDQLVRVWSTSDGALQHRLSGHLGTARDVAFVSADLLASSGTDGVLLLWSLTTGAAVATLTPLAGRGWAILLPDGRYVLDGEVDDAFWWAVKLCRFGAGELDRPRDPQVVRVPVGRAPLL